MVILPSWNYRLTNLALWIDRDTAVDLAESNCIAAVDQLTRWGSRGKPGGRSGHIEDYPGPSEGPHRSLQQLEIVLSSPSLSPSACALLCQPAPRRQLRLGLLVSAGASSCASLCQRDPRGLRKTPVSSRQSPSATVSLPSFCSRRKSRICGICPQISHFVEPVDGNGRVNMTHGRQFTRTWMVNPQRSRDPCSRRVSFQDLGEADCQRSDRSRILSRRDLTARWS